MGKYGDPEDSKWQASGESFDWTIRHAIAAGWNPQNIGHHIVRNNVIHDCQEAGIVGAFGAIYSQVTGNHIYDIFTFRQFLGEEIAGIKLHTAVDVLIADNRIHNAGLGLWLDWMAQGTRVTRNLFYDNDFTDIYLEVNHGPYLIDNNLLLSPYSFHDLSEGSGFVHNLIAGRIETHPDPRVTPYFVPHDTRIAGETNVPGGDARFYNNIFLGDASAVKVVYNHVTDVKHDNWDVYNYRNRYGLITYSDAKAVQTGGNLYLGGAQPMAGEQNGLASAASPLSLTVYDDGAHVRLRWAYEGKPLQPQTAAVTTQVMGKTRLAQAAYENVDGTPLTVDRDYLGKPRDAKAPAPGPFEAATYTDSTFAVW